MENTPQRSRITLGVFLALLALLIWANFRLVSPYLLTVVMGGLIAALCRGIYRWLINKRLSPNRAALFVTSGVTLLVVIPVCLFAMLAVGQAIEVAKVLASDPGFSIDRLSEKITKWPPAHQLLGNARAIEQKGRELLQSVASAAPGVMFRIFGGLPEFVIQLALGLLSCFFLLRDGAKFLNWMRDKLPLEPEVRSSIFRAFQETAVGSILATLIAALVQAVIMLVAFLVLGVPAAILAGGLTFIFAWIPILGSGPIWLGGAIYLFSTGETVRAVVMLGFGALCGLSDNVVHPWVLKGRGQLHPLVSLVAIFGGIVLFGLFGVFIGPILAALLVATLNSWPMVGERYGILRSCQIVTTDAPPVPAKEESPIILSEISRDETI